MSTSHLLAAGKRRTAAIPSLENGDHLDADEFLRRYEAMEEAGDTTRAELIDGRVYLMTPLSLEGHGKPNSIVQLWLAYYATYAPAVEHALNATIRLGRKNVPQPDGILWDTNASNARLTNKYLEGAPELVAETSFSSVSRDSNEKLRSYLKAGICEYVLWRTQDGVLDWFAIKGGKYVRLESDGLGIMRSRRFPGLWLNVPALLKMDRKQVLQTLDAGLAEAGLR